MYQDKSETHIFRQREYLFLNGCGIFSLFILNLLFTHGLVIRDREQNSVHLGIFFLPLLTTHLKFEYLPKTHIQNVGQRPSKQNHVLAPVQNIGPWSRGAKQ
jgi:hypothetical protein